MGTQKMLTKYDVELHSVQHKTIKYLRIGPEELNTEGVCLHGSDAHMSSCGVWLATKSC
jgi:hypothetical protein